MRRLGVVDPESSSRAFLRVPTPSAHNEADEAEIHILESNNGLSAGNPDVLEGADTQGIQHTPPYMVAP